MTIPLDHYEPAPTRKPGDFRRRGVDGPPIVPSLTKTRQPTGKKAELIAKCEARGIDVPDKITVAQLKELLGPEPADETYGRPSGFGDPLENSFALRKHIERNIGRGFLLLVLRGLDPSTVDLDDDGTLDRLVLDAQDAAEAMIWADRGTHVHMLCERHELGKDWGDLIPAGEALGIPEALQRRIVDEWAAFRASLAVRSLACEIATVNDTTRLAGTADNLDVADRDIDTEFGTIPAGEAFIGDIKTGDPRDKHAVQISTYADGRPFDVDAEQRLDWDQRPHADVGLIYHMSMKAVLDGAPVEWEAIPVDLSAGREGARICCEARDWPAAPVFGTPIKIAAPSAPPDVEQPAAEPGEDVTANATPPARAAERREQLRERKVRMQSNANDTGWGRQFEAQWATFGITPESTDDEIQAALDAIEPPFDVVTEPQERNLGSSGRYSGTYVVINGPVRERPDDGGPLDQPSLDALFAAIKASPARPVVNGWLRQAADAGESWNPRVRPTIRNFEISRAAYHMALATDGDDEVARTILAAVIPAERHTVIQPAFDVGVTLGALTIDEARAVVDVAERLTTTKSERGESPADVVAAVLAAA